MSLRPSISIIYFYKTESIDGSNFSSTSSNKTSYPELIHYYNPFKKCYSVNLITFNSLLNYFSHLLAYP